ncbi:MAG: hypothetical protein KDD69_19850 [Bdellovibrionales bacterium]|nr:hypothetical protein [Bdellovibrionales bacterium]
MAIDWKTYRQNVTVQAAPSRKKRTQEEKLGELAPFAIGEIYRGEKVTIDDCAKHLGDKTTNSAATLLGRGVGGSGGANVWVFKKEILPCKDNVILLSKFLSDAGFAQLLEDLGLTEEEFINKVEGMPEASAIIATA